MVLYELTELKTKGITELRKIAKELGVDAKGYTKDDKDDLARKIARSTANKGGAKRASRRRSSARRSPRKTSRRRASPKRTAPKAAAGDDLDKMTVAQLKAFAKKKGIAGYTRYTKKAELLDFIKRQMGKGGEAPSPRRRASPRRKPSAEKKAGEEEVLSKMTVAQLKAFAKKNGISLVGKSALKKAQLIAYIESELGGGAPPSPRRASARRASARRAAGKAAAGDDLSAMTVVQLKAFAKKNGISLVGKSGLKKAELRAYIEEEMGEEAVGGMPPPTPPKPRKKKPEVVIEEEEEEEEIPVPPVFEEEEEETIPMPTPIIEEEEEETIPMPTPIVEEEYPEVVVEEEEFVEPEESERDKLKKLKLTELKAKLLEEGIVAPSGLSKEEIIDEFFYGERCDPENDEMCTGDKYCDIRPLPEHKGICISPTRKSKDLSEFIYKGKKIVGSSEAISALREKLEPKPAKPAAAEISPEDIEDVLREVREEPHEGNLDEIGEQVLKCLGVLSS